MKKKIISRYVLTQIGILSATMLLAQNTFFAPNEHLIYEFVYISAQKDTLAKGKILVKPTSDKWEYDSQQLAVTYEYTFDKRDSNYFQTGLHELPVDNKLTETTGYIENDKSFWTHPFRANVFYITEVAPFPQYIKDGKRVKIKTSLYIGEGWGRFEGVVKSGYKVSNYENTLEEYPNQIIQKVIMKARHKLGKSYLSLLVSDSIGILLMDYRFFNNDTLTIVLKEKKQP